VPKPTAVTPTADRVALTYDQAGELLGLSGRSVARLVKDGELRAILIRRSVRITRSEIERYTIALEAASHGLGPQPAPPRKRVAA
jgi:excisionase family DNA binding protein